eukprot:2703969-Pyramimonas_sp.AAC.1
MSTHLAYVSWPHRELHPRPQRPRPHVPAQPISAHPSHAPWPHRELHPRPQTVSYTHLTLPTILLV